MSFNGLLNKTVITYIIQLITDPCGKLKYIDI